MILAEPVDRGFDDAKPHQILIDLTVIGVEQQVEHQPHDGRAHNGRQENHALRNAVEFCLLVQQKRQEKRQRDDDKHLAEAINKGICHALPVHFIAKNACQIF